MSDAFTAVVVCIAGIGAAPDLVQCPHTLLLDDGGYSVNGKGYTLQQCIDRLTYLYLPGETMKFCATSPLRKDQIRSLRRETRKPAP